jgi:hypothetical protein
LWQRWNAFFGRVQAALTDTGDLGDVGLINNEERFKPEARTVQFEETLVSLSRTLHFSPALNDIGAI